MGVQIPPPPTGSVQLCQMTLTGLVLSAAAEDAGAELMRALW